VIPGKNLADIQPLYPVRRRIAEDVDNTGAHGDEHHDERVRGRDGANDLVVEVSGLILSFRHLG